MLIEIAPRTLVFQSACAHAEWIGGLKLAQPMRRGACDDPLPRCSSRTVCAIRCVCARAKAARPCTAAKSACSPRDARGLAWISQASRRVRGLARRARCFKTDNLVCCCEGLFPCSAIASCIVASVRTSSPRWDNRWDNLSGCLVARPRLLETWPFFSLIFRSFSGRGNYTDR